jgi:hypothetical protein
MCSLWFDFKTIGRWRLLNNVGRSSRHPSDALRTLDRKTVVSDFEVVDLSTPWQVHITSDIF